MEFKVGDVVKPSVLTAHRSVRCLSCSLVYFVERPFVSVTHPLASASGPRHIALPATVKLRSVFVREGARSPLNAALKAVFCHLNRINPVFVLYDRMSAAGAWLISGEWVDNLSKQILEESTKGTMRIFVDVVHECV